ncbi:MAG: HTH domain-containing protein, partial [Clostridia bacterium]
MTTKEKVLQMLSQQPEGLSGQQLAMKLGISRSAVWKAVQSLKNEGCQIEGVT